MWKVEKAGRGIGCLCIVERGQIMHITLESKIRRLNWWQKHCLVPIQVEKSVHREETHTKGCRETHTKGRKEVRPKSGKEADGCSART